MNLNGKAVLITGAAMRIGRGIALALAREGCRLVLHCNHSVLEGKTLVNELKKSGVSAVLIKSNLLEYGAAEKLVQRAIRAFGHLDAIINNAAIFSKASITTSTEEDFRKILEVNLLAAVLVTRAFAKYARSGKIINILDRRIAGVEGGLAGYLLSKKALADFTKIAALELAPGITVNGIAPGAVLRAADRRLRDKAGKIPLGKRPSVADIAAAVVFLLKSDAITGEIIFVDGGQHLLG
jgi:NAD(P)-dependent dehydrogenase (short-subunit alcohol dehydrogenase family)